jgi:hypothetical protein
MADFRCCLNPVTENHGTSGNILIQQQQLLAELEGAAQVLAVRERLNFNYVNPAISSKYLHIFIFNERQF